MGYEYYFLITVEDRDGVAPEEIEQKWFPQFKAAYDRFAPTLDSKSKEKDEWFPTVTEPEHSGSGGFGTGPNDQMLASFGKFTALFPQFAFGLYLFHWDMTKMTAYTIKGDSILDQQGWDLETVKVFGNQMTVTLAPDSVNLESDITYIFGSKYRKDDDLQWKHEETDPTNEPRQTVVGPVTAVVKQ
ncbi:Hypothetical protein POVN_LOCUS317 [uncultured virus]|nr:Hypothetical protein POVN_LOCUS317 [uncultured virus]